jgi:hypothetical protein
MFNLVGTLLRPLIQLKILQWISLGLITAMAIIFSAFSLVHAILRGMITLSGRWIL